MHILFKPQCFVFVLLPLPGDMLEDVKTMTRISSLTTVDFDPNGMQLHISLLWSPVPRRSTNMATCYVLAPDFIISITAVEIILSRSCRAMTLFWNIYQEEFLLSIHDVLCCCFLFFLQSDTRPTAHKNIQEVMKTPAS